MSPRSGATARGRFALRGFAPSRARARSLLAVVALYAAFALCAAVAGAQVPYNSYMYGIWGYSVPAAAAYLPERVLNGRDLGAGPMKGPKDMCLSPAGELFILDAGNKRILVLDGGLKLARSISAFAGRDGKPFELQDPRGIFVDATGSIYVADRGAKTVYAMDGAGRVRLALGKPVSDLVPSNQEYYPEKVLTDSSGVIYVLGFGFYQGALCFDQEGAFLGFFGSNKVTVTGKLLSDRFWRLFLSKAQRDKMTRYVPAQYANFAIDKENFVYTVSDFGDDSQSGQAKKLNPLSQNILFYNRKPDLQYFGDYETVWNRSTSRQEKSIFSAIHVDDDGFIELMDKERGRVFMYDQDSNLIAIFGGPGDQAGTFRSPVAITSMGDRVLVLDEAKNSLTAFKPTRFGKLVRRATVLYRQGDYFGALGPWNEVLKMNANYDLAYRGKGKALRQLGRYAEALAAFRTAQYHRFYSDAFKDLRNRVLRDNFGLIASLLAAGAIAWALLGRRRKVVLARDPDRVRGLRDISPARYPFHLVLHPVAGYDDLKAEGKGSLKAANLIMLSFFLMNVAQFLFTGFNHNYARLDELNAVMIFARTVGVCFLWSMANWGICTLTDGKGSFREIWIFTSYALLSYVLLNIPILILSNVLVIEERVFLTIGSFLANAWTAIQLIAAMKAVHQFTLKRTLVSMGLTAVGIVLIVVVGLLLYTLIAQLAAFGITIYQEILLRI
jgi:tetratricopeptide (TPR) repeat protein